MPKANVGGTTLHYTSDGDERAPPLVFANSLGADHTMWDPQLPAFARHFRVIRYDARGHGESAVTPGPYTVETLARDAIALLDHLRIGQAAFCGLSLGGATPSALHLSVLSGVDVPADYPACPGLRGQPCRAYQPIVNLHEDAP